MVGATPFESVVISNVRSSILQSRRDSILFANVATVLAPIVSKNGGSLEVEASHA